MGSLRTEALILEDQPHSLHHCLQQFDLAAKGLNILTYLGAFGAPGWSRHVGNRGSVGLFNQHLDLLPPGNTCFNRDYDAVKYYSTEQYVDDRKIELTKLRWDVRSYPIAAGEGCRSPRMFVGAGAVGDTDLRRTPLSLGMRPRRIPQYALPGLGLQVMMAY